MRTISPDELAETLAGHKTWVATDGAEGVRADLGGAYLRGANLRGAYLRGAYLTGADLTSAYLSWTDLRGADLTGADLRSAYLFGADLTGADLRGADLRSADLRGADLRGAYLRGAYLRGAELRGARMDAAEIAARSIVPAVGPFRGWKKVADGTVVELEIPADAARCGGVTSRKCRASHVRVVAGEGVSWKDGETRYAPGAIVRAANYDTDPLVVCGGGIHFFMSPDEAAGYDFG